MGDFNNQDNKDYRSDESVEEQEILQANTEEEQPVIQEDNQNQISQYQQLKQPEYQSFNHTGQIQNHYQNQNQNQNQHQNQIQNQYQYQQYESPKQMNQPYQPRRQGMAIASMVLGIISLLTTCTIIIPIPTAIIGIILGIISIRYKYDGRGMAIAGIILSSISLLVVILMIIGYIAFSDYMVNEFYREFNMDQFYRDYGSDIFEEFRYEFNIK